VLVRLAFPTTLPLQHRGVAVGGYLTPRFVPKFVSAIIGAHAPVADCARDDTLRSA
jgi:hypothetical protein